MTTESPSYSTIEQAFSLGNGQDSALNWLRKNRSQVAIFLVSGIKLEGTISGFDQYSVLLTEQPATGLQGQDFHHRHALRPPCGQHPARPQTTRLHGAAPPRCTEPL